MIEGTAPHAVAERIVFAALSHVPFDGWTSQALRRGAADEGVAPAIADLAFPGGGAEAIEIWSAACDRHMAERIAATADWETRRIRARVAAAVRLRLEALGGEREAVRRALTFLALPQHTALAMKLLYRTVDEIWYACGDRATDFNFYTKRALLAGVYSSTLLCWLDDTTESHAETWAFLDRRIDNVMQVPKLTARLKRRPRLKGRAVDPGRFARRVTQRLREGKRV